MLPLIRGFENHSDTTVQFAAVDVSNSVRILGEVPLDIFAIIQGSGRLSIASKDDLGPICVDLCRAFAGYLLIEFVPDLSAFGLIQGDGSFAAWKCTCLSEVDFRNLGFSQAGD